MLVADAFAHLERVVTIVLLALVVVLQVATWLDRRRVEKATLTLAVDTEGYARESRHAIKALTKALSLLVTTVRPDLASQLEREIRNGARDRVPRAIEEAEQEVR